MGLTWKKRVALSGLIWQVDVPLSVEGKVDAEQVTVEVVKFISCLTKTFIKK
ncbi:hypothetical protein ACIQXF_02460 [Lysinibacillus sp. NPDC097231]|uniref:hypothetical protein n=1 Tax=Lysinibacillus sp. NPDC097231 TaxID=3364142 RepID=UPI0038129201